MTQTRPMFPHALDSTMMAAFRSCPQKMFRTYVEHWKPQAESVHLVAGGAFATGIEVARKEFYEKGSSAEDSVAAGMQACLVRYGDFECPPESAKSLERTVGALEFYFDNYPLGADGMEPITLAGGRRGIEFSFATPLGINHPVTGNPILYTGRTDMIAEYAGGVYIVDEKTTSQLGASWSRQWEMRGQFTGYQWAAGENGIVTNGSIVRGVSILKTKYDTQQAITYRTPWEIDRWYQQTLRDVQRMIQCWEAGWWDFAMDGACAEYGGCSLTRICKSQDPSSWLPIYFEQRVWDPLAREEKTVSEWEASWGHGDHPPGELTPHVQKPSGAQDVVMDLPIGR
jgi:PD-(D/E)XK nuclease superfamily protein